MPIPTARTRSLLACAFSATLYNTTMADGLGREGYGEHFQRIATLPNYLNNPEISDKTVSEIVAASKNERTLVYTDSERETIGIIDISDPSSPTPLGTVAVGGEPTSVAVLRNNLALVAVNTSETLTDTSGTLVVVQINRRTVIGEIELGGQPDSIALSPDGRFAAIAVENERDEDLCVGGELSGFTVPDDECEDAGGEVGVIPQTAGSPLDTNHNLNNPPGFLAVVDIRGEAPKDWKLRTVELTDLASLAPSDPEPEFVDVNEDNQAVVTLQENNHIAIVDLPSGQVAGDFDLGAVDLVGIDATEDGIISLTETLHNVPREPDAVTWINSRYDQPTIATANEGDLFGGSRGFSIFRPNGQLLFDSGNRFEELAVQHGHYPEERSENKGSEPEAIEFGRFNGEDYLFVGSERGSFIAVYQLDYWGQPRFVQLLPAPLEPEGVLALPKRKLLIVSGEEDDPTFGVRSSVMIYRLESGKPSYPQILSAKVHGQPIPWSALSGMDTLPNGDLVAVWDSFYSESKLFHIDPYRRPAVVTGALRIQGGGGDFDPEGVAVAPDGSLWIASEGNRTGTRLNRLLHIDAAGSVIQEVFLPPEIEACREAERIADGNITSHIGGFEGLAILPSEDGYQLLVAQQRGWDYTTPDCEELDDDPEGVNPAEPTQTRIWIYDPLAMTWDFVPYELAPVPTDATWVGLSEITRVGDGSYVLVERDNRTGDFASHKTLVRVDAADMRGGVTADEKAIYDLIPDLEATRGWITDKPEGVAINHNREVFVVSDNDGVDDWSGESWFLRLGEVDDLFGDEDGEDQEDEQEKRIVLRR